MSVYSPHTSLFVDGTIMCTQVDATGAFVAQTSQPIVASGSGSGGDLMTQAQCAPGDQAAAFYTDTGGGFDSFQLFCSHPSCQ